MGASQSRKAWDMLEFREIGGIEKAEGVMKGVVGQVLDVSDVSDVLEVL